MYAIRSYYGINNLRDTYAYDSSGNLVEEHNQYWASAAWTAPVPPWTILV